MFDTTTNDQRTGASRRERAHGAFRAFARDVRGMAAIEMALIFPVMLLLYFGLVDVSNLLAANRKVTLTTSTIADLVAQAPGLVTRAEIEGFFDAADPIMDPYATDEVGYSVIAYGEVDDEVQEKWSYTQGGLDCSGEVSADLDSLAGDGNDVIVAQVCFQWRPVVGQVIGTAPIALEDTMALRPRQTFTIECEDC